MRRALALAGRAAQRGDVPIAAIVVYRNQVLAAASNRRESAGDATAHAEILALRRACRRLGDWRLNGATLYITMEPCLMCFGAAYQARVSKIVYACSNPKNPRLLRQVYQQWPGTPEMLGGIMQDEALKLLSKFFSELR